MESVWIFLGAGFGGVFRFWTAKGMQKLLGQAFPYGTLTVNALGSLLMGFLFILFIERLNGIAPNLRNLLLIGFLGGYTTFSSFSIETILLLESRAWLGAILNILLNVGLCIPLAWAGVLVARAL